jgi:DNA-binding transcriptional LysR family regulator
MTGAEIRGAKARFEELGVDELVMICPADHELAGVAGVTTGRAAQAPFIMREEGSGTRLVTESVLRGAGIDPGDLHVVTELGTSEAIVNAVEGGMGIAVVSRFVASKAIELGTVKRIDTGDFPANRPLYAVVTRGTPSRAAAAFLEHLRAKLPPA